jgi:hypothetical protein
MINATSFLGLAINALIALSLPCIFVTMGCRSSAGSLTPEAVGSEKEVVVDNAITTPPHELNLDTFYKKYISAAGIPVISSAKVPDEALYAVQRTIKAMMSLRPDVLAKMIENNARVGILAKTEVTTDVPELRFLKDDSSTKWDELRGVGAEVETPISTCAEENVLCYGEGQDPYYYEDIVIHEFAHSIHSLGISFVDTNFNHELKEAFENAKTRRLWKKTYAGSNPDEYFAEGVQCWFNLNAESIPADGIHNEINTREELKKYDQALYDLVRKYFPAEYERFSCHQKN